MVTAYTIPPAGVTAASFFTPAAIVDPGRPPALLSDNIAPDGDFASIFLSRHPVDAAIGEAFRLKRDTGAALEEAGQRFEDIKKNLPTTPRELQDEARRIMQPFVDRGDATIVKLEVDTTQAFDLGAILVTYTNNQTRKSQEVRG